MAAPIDSTPRDLTAGAAEPAGTAESPTATSRSAGKLGMILALLALGMLFAAAMVAYLVVRLRAPAWPPPGSPRLPGGLWISTLLILLSSYTMHRAGASARAGGGERLRRWLLITAVLGVAFLASQIINWVRLITVHHLPAQSNLYAFTFYLLSGLHGAHVVGGLVPLGIIAARAGRGRYTAASHEGVDYISMYWHFLDVVWLVIFTVLMIAA